MVSGVGAILDALRLGAGMTWEVLWALILGFALSGVVQAVVSKSEMTALLPDDSPRSLERATLLGAASSLIVVSGLSSLSPGRAHTLTTLSAPAETMRVLSAPMPTPLTLAS